MGIQVGELRRRHTGDTGVYWVSRIASRVVLHPVFIQEGYIRDGSGDPIVRARSTVERWQRVEQFEQ
jgi:hypothetical protein